MSKRTLHRILKNFGELIIIKFIFFDRQTNFFQNFCVRQDYRVAIWRQTI